MGCVKKKKKYIIKIVKNNYYILLHRPTYCILLLFILSYELKLFNTIILIG